MGTKTKVLTKNQAEGIKIEKRPHAAVPPYRSDGQTVRASACTVWEQSLRATPGTHVPAPTCPAALGTGPRPHTTPAPPRSADTGFLSPETHLPPQGSTPAPGLHRARLSGAMRAPPGGLTAGRRSKAWRAVSAGAGRGPGRGGAPGGMGGRAGAEKPRAPERPVGCSSEQGIRSFVQEATWEGQGGAGRGTGPRDGSQRVGGDAPPLSPGSYTALTSGATLVFYVLKK